MRVRIRKSEISGSITAPPSKSYTHRAFFIGLLANGKTRIMNPLICRDTEASLKALRLFGADASWDHVLSDGTPTEPIDVVDCRSSATTARISAAIAAVVDGLTVLTGSDSLRRRSMKPIIEALGQLGVKVYSRRGYLPAAIIGGEVKNHSISIEGNISSQFITGLLLLGAKIGLTINVTTEMKSKPYVELTLKMLGESGVRVERNGFKRFSVERQEVRPGKFKIPGDYSSASFFLAAGALYGRVRVENLDPNDVQGDRNIIDLLREMGANVRTFNWGVEVESGELRGVKVNCSDIPDLAPILAVLGIYARGETVIYGAEHLRFKETNRLHVLCENLRKMGAKVEERRDGLIIRGGGRIRGSVLDPHSDHRLAMALSIAALGAEDESIILNAESVEDSYPNFYDHLKALNGFLVVENDG